ncbi:hypothetical protein BACFIN_08325 [Bacteroides finegoldii DSM 17565]|nr:hypothetical protein BACFIN_08325 [Bacteroides finegoldii DSM 17565]
MKREKPCFHIERKTLKKGHRTRSRHYKINCVTHYFLGLSI